MIPLLLLIAAYQEGHAPDLVGSPLADDLVRIDDFDGDALDAVWRWTSDETPMRVVENGAVVLEARASQAVVPGHGPQSTSLRVASSRRVDELGATVTLEDYEAIDATARVRLGLYYQPPADRGTTTNLAFVRLGIEVSQSQAPRFVVTTNPCLDQGCTSGTPRWPPTPFYSSPLDVVPGEPHHLSLRYDEGSNQFLAEVDGLVGWLDASRLGVFDPDDQFDAAVEVAADNGAQSSPRAHVRALVDDVEVNGAAWDDFSSGMLDPSRWREGEWARRLEDGSLVLDVRSSAPGPMTSLVLRDAPGVGVIAATVRVDASQAAATDQAFPAAGVGGFWYRDGDAQVGRVGQVFAFSEIAGEEALWIVGQCLDPECGVAECFGEGSLGPVSSGQQALLYAAYDGEIFTFQRDADPPVTFDPTSAGAASTGTRAGASVGLWALHQSVTPGRRPGWCVCSAMASCRSTKTTAPRCCAGRTGREPTRSCVG